MQHQTARNYNIQSFLAIFGRGDMKTRYALLLAVLIALVVQVGLAQGGPGMTDPPMQEGLHFVSQPPPFVRVNVPYLYTAKAISRDSTSVIHYFIDGAAITAAGLSIDSITGVVTWTPKLPGWYPVAIVARSNKGEFGVQRFTVAVTSGNGIVQGKVTDAATSLGIPGIIIELLQAVNATPMNAIYYTYTTKTDLHGNYRIVNVDTGRYKIHAISPDPRYVSQWYDGTSELDSAKVVWVPDSPSVTQADFRLRGGPTPQQLISVSGKVVDTAAAPIGGAEVFFVHTGFALNANSTVDDFRKMFDLVGSTLDFRMDGISVHVFRAVTGSEGKYGLKVVPGEYIAFARKKGYVTCFLVNATDMLGAKRLQLTRDTTGVDFTLRQLPPVVLGQIKGSVLDTTKGVGVRSRIIAFRNLWSATAAPYFLPRSFTTDTDSLGAYTLGDLPPGGYFVLALPMGSYAPAFYTADTPSTNWRRATPVLVQGNVVTGIDIHVHEMPVTACGFAGIRGQITTDGGPLGSVAGTIVYAWLNSVVVGFGIADGSGHYEIAGLAPGTYAVSADLPGYANASAPTASVSYTQTGSPQYATVNLAMSMVTSVAEAGATTPETFALSQNYPNPFNPSTSISYQLPATAKVDLRVYDVLGREVAVLASGVQNAGEHTVKFDAISLSTGVYFYRLSAGSAMETKKMLLMK
jgi:hypothetical protein